MNLRIIIGEASAEITEKKSRFIADIKEVHTEEEALGYLEAKKKQYWDARHNCYAFIIGKDGNLARFSDDKEPSGTAGKPILETLTGQNVKNAIIVVTRYFGGVLLGTGGLVRAYSAAASAALQSAKLLEAYDGNRLKFCCEYKDIGRFESLMENFNMSIISKEYLENAKYDCIIENSRFDTFLKESREITKGGFTPLSVENVTFVKDGRNAIIYNFN